MTTDRERELERLVLRCLGAMAAVVDPGPLMGIGAPVAIETIASLGPNDARNALDGFAELVRVSPNSDQSPSLAGFIDSLLDAQRQIEADEKH